jgi:uncharacterized protein
MSIWAYHPPAWLPDGHSQTIVPSLWAGRTVGRSGIRFQRERWHTPDHDFIDVDRVRPIHAVHDANSTIPLLVVFHGLEGSSQSHYAQAFARYALTQHCECAIPHFRGCSGELNATPRAYHSGDFLEIDWILRRFKAEAPHRPIWAVGISLGGNALCKWAGESGSQARHLVQAIAAVCAPLDLAASGRAMGRGFNRHVYTRMFLKTMIPKALQKLEQFPQLFNGVELKKSQTLYEFDNLFTAPLHGYKDTEDYWARASAKPVLPDICVPTLLLNAKNDPFIPAISLPTAAQVSAHVSLWQPRHGGHVGFPSRHWQHTPEALFMEMPSTVGRWLLNI